MSSSDWLSLSSICIDVVSIIVGGVIAIWVVQKIQSKLDSEQKLRDYFCDELKYIRDSYREIIQNLFKGNMYAKDFKNRMYSLSVQSTNLMKHLEEKFGIQNTLANFQWQLYDKVENTPAYGYAIRTHRQLRFSDDSINEIRGFVEQNSSVFNDIVEKIYESE